MAVAAAIALAQRNGLLLFEFEDDRSDGAALM